MTSENWPQIALTVLALGAVVAGIASVGGPNAARIEKRDNQRLSELRGLIWHTQCLARENGNTLPDMLTVTDTCPDKLAEDALLRTEGYRYFKVDETSFKICADFEDIVALQKRRPSEALDEAGCHSANL
ncbi:hypothetical protein [Celeribacter halophilus]|uniref:Uncharacterized protein n=1 Tax=Celeribacter halophilus TaxID=576117 RepID=A0A1I3VTF8_9RHOB|nr:hypothetical protein [Celeribacter halophilus]PZX08419.1 hypothetical protein LX82_03206 [Celeribacter halophilus]SFJ97431.1 hypothetical protein SAMN04488138_1178 [Celeribacter halophilus]